MHHRPRNAARLSLLAERATAMRRAPSEPERLLWSALSGARQGMAFRRQAVLLGRYIVDFVAPAAKLVIEVDGRHHERQRRADARRDRALEIAGYTVLRFTADEVLHELDAVLRRVRAVVRIS